MKIRQPEKWLRMKGNIMKKHNLSRRRFIKYSTMAGVHAAFASPILASVTDNAELRAVDTDCDLAVVTGSSPAKNCLKAVDVLGGFSRFVRSGDSVVIKPNPVGRNRPEQAINTHPEMVRVVVSECIKAGAKTVKVVSHDDSRSFIMNGTAEAVEQAGGSWHALNEESQYRSVVVPRGTILRHERIAADILDADVFINMPIAKHHAGSTVTLSMKNLMGINWDRIRFHRTDLHQCIAELAATVRQSLIIMDANHVLLTNGPIGPGEVKAAQTVIAGVDPVALDAYVTHLFWQDPAEIRHIRIAHELGVGEIDFTKLSMREIRV